MYINETTTEAIWTLMQGVA